MYIITWQIPTYDGNLHERTFKTNDRKEALQKLDSLRHYRNPALNAKVTETNKK